MNFPLDLEALESLPNDLGLINIYNLNGIQKEYAEALIILARQHKAILDELRKLENKRCVLWALYSYELGIENPTPWCKISVSDKTIYSKTTQKAIGTMATSELATLVVEAVNLLDENFK